jgi:NitT/TauT family transport system substrate-binding protein
MKRTVSEPRRSFTLLAAAAVAVPALRAQGSRRREGCPSRSAARPAFYYLPLTISEQLGYFKAEGLDVEISDFAGGARRWRRWWADRPTW